MDSDTAFFDSAAIGMVLGAYALERNGWSNVVLYIVLVMLARWINGLYRSMRAKKTLHDYEKEQAEHG